MTTTQEILDRVNAKIAEIQAKVANLGSPTRIGSDGRDFLFGSSFGDSFLDGRGGNDRVFGRFGDDTLLGGEGEDLVDGGFGDDLILGGDEDDKLFGKFGNDEILGGTGDDLVDGSVGDDFLDGGLGDDQLIGGPGNDQLFGGGGSDTLTGVGNLTGDIEVDFLVGGGDFLSGSVAPDGSPDLFVLGNVDGSFYTNSGPENSGGIFGFGDFAAILDFESGLDKIQISASVAQDPNSILFANAFLGLGTYIVDNGDLIGFVSGDAPLSANDFVLAQ